MLRIFQPLQILYIPGLILLLGWVSYMSVFRKDKAAGLVLYLGLVIVVDSFLDTGIYVPGLAAGSLKYSEIYAAVLLLTQRPQRRVAWNGTIAVLSAAFLAMVMFSFFVGFQSNVSTVDVSRLIVPPLFALVAIWKSRGSSAETSSSERATTALVGLYFMLVILSCFAGFSMENGLGDLRRIVVPQLVAFWISYKGFRNKDDYERFFLYLVVLIIAIAVFTAWDLFFDISLLKSDQLNKPEYWLNRRNGRFGSFFLNPNYMGAFCILTFFGMLASFITQKTPWKKVVAFTGLLALSFALVETQSRGPMLSFGAGMLVFLFLPTGRLRFLTKVAGIIILSLVLLSLMPGFLGHVAKRFDTIGKETSMKEVSRYALWAYTTEIIADYPVLGIGAGEANYRDYMEKYGFVKAFGRGSLDNPHNSYLQLAVYAGIPSLAVFILLNVTLFVKGVGTAMRASGGYAPLLVGLLSGMAAFLTSLLADMHMFAPTVASVYWVYFGLTSSMLGNADRDRNSSLLA